MPCKDGTFLTVSPPRTTDRMIPRPPVTVWGGRGSTDLPTARSPAPVTTPSPCPGPGTGRLSAAPSRWRARGRARAVGAENRAEEPTTVVTALLEAQHLVRQARDHTLVAYALGRARIGPAGPGRGRVPDSGQSDPGGRVHRRCPASRRGLVRSPGQAGRNMSGAVMLLVAIPRLAPARKRPPGPAVTLPRGGRPGYAGSRDSATAYVDQVPYRTRMVFTRQGEDLMPLAGRRARDGALSEHDRHHQERPARTHPGVPAHGRGR